MNYFLKVMCDYGHINKLSQIIEAYENKLFASKKILRATLYYVNKPDAEIVKGFEKMLCGKYGAKAAMLELEQDDNLIGGYKLVVGDTEFDKSIQGAVIAMKSKLIGGV